MDDGEEGLLQRLVSPTHLLLCSLEVGGVFRTPAATGRIFIQIMFKCRTLLTDVRHFLSGEVVVESHDVGIDEGGQLLDSFM